MLKWCVYITDYETNRKKKKKRQKWLVTNRQAGYIYPRTLKEI